MAKAMDRTGCHFPAIDVDWDNVTPSCAGDAFAKGFNPEIFFPLPALLFSDIFPAVIRTRRQSIRDKP